MSEFSDTVAGVGGTPLDAAHLDVMVVAQSFLISGGLPTPAASLTLTQPATVAVVKTDVTTATYVTPASQSLTFAANKDTYVDLNTSGVYTLVPVNNGAAAPAVTANSIRLYMAVSSGSGVTSVTQLCPSLPVGPGMVGPLAAPAPVRPSNASFTATTWATPFSAPSVTTWGGTRIVVSLSLIAAPAINTPLLYLALLIDGVDVTGNGATIGGALITSAALAQTANTAVNGWQAMAFTWHTPLLAAGAHTVQVIGALSAAGTYQMTSSVVSVRESL